MFTVYRNNLKNVLTYDVVTCVVGVVTKIFRLVQQQCKKDLTHFYYDWKCDLKKA